MLIHGQTSRNEAAKVALRRLSEAELLRTVGGSIHAGFAAALGCPLLYLCMRDHAKVSYMFSTPRRHLVWAPAAPALSCLRFP